MSSKVYKWNFYRLFSEVLCDRLTCLTWCKENGLLPSVIICPEGHTIVVTEEEIRQAQFTSGELQCSRKHSRKEDMCAWWTGSWFERSQFSLAKTLMLTYSFSRGLTLTTAIRECSSSMEETISTEDVVEFYLYCRELMADYILQNRNFDGQLGGEGQVIEIYESKFGQRKYNRCKIKRGTHIICIIEKNSKRFRAITCPAIERNYGTLLEIIEKNVAQGSTIVTEECSEYRDRSQSYKFLPQTVKTEILVNLRKRGLRPEDTKNSKKRKRTTINKALGDELLEHVWRREMKINDKDNFECFLEIIRSYFIF